MPNNLGDIFPTIKLRWKFSIVIISIASLMGGLFFLLVQSTMSKILVSEIEERGIVLSRAIAASSADLILRDNTIKLQFMISEVIEREKDVRYVYIHNNKGKVLAHTFNKGFPRELPKKIATTANMKTVPYLITSYDTENGMIKDIACPLLNWDVGAVHIGLDLKSIHSAIAHVNRILVVIILAVSFLGIILAFILSLLIAKPLVKLADHAKKIGDGNLDLEIFIRGNDEISDLSGSINKMTRSLKQNFARRQEAEDQLADEKERLSVTLRSIGDGVITTDIDGNIALLNKVAEKLTGWTQKEANGRPLPEVFHIINEKTRKPCKNPAIEIMGKGEIFNLANQTLLLSKDSTERSITYSGAPIMDKANQIIGSVLVFRDITREKKVEEELRKIDKLESVGVLAGGIAHDFNNILMAILGNLNLANLKINPDDDVAVPLKRAEEASLRAKGLTQQLLTFSKGGAPIKETALISETIKDSANFVLHGSNIICEYDMPRDLWAVEIDKGQISQVVQNLIINAKHAMPQGGVIKIKCDNVEFIANEDIPLPHENNYLKITISDNGAGISEDAIENIFDPYFSTKKNGSGLGLAISHSIISKHNGHIGVQSKPGQGTTFTIYLPTSARSHPADKEKATIYTKGSGKILVMDDEAMVRNVAQSMLMYLGYEVVCANHGTEAIDLYRQAYSSGKPIDVVILDLTIPGGLGGKETAQEILAVNADAKIIASSGYSNDPVMANYQEYGFWAAIVKPYELAELHGILVESIS